MDKMRCKFSAYGEHGDTEMSGWIVNFGTNGAKRLAAIIVGDNGKLYRIYDFDNVWDVEICNIETAILAN